MSEMANRSEHGFSRGMDFLTVKPGCSVKDENGQVLWRAGDEVDQSHPAYAANQHRCYWVNRQRFEAVTTSKVGAKRRAKKEAK